MAGTKRAVPPKVARGEDFTRKGGRLSYKRRAATDMARHEICTDVKAGRLDDQSTKGKGHTRAWWKRRATKQVRRHERAQVALQGE